MNKIIIVAGASGNLGKRICKSLIEKGAVVKALVRKNSDSKKIEELESLGLQVFPVDYSDKETLIDICKDAHCVVSVFSGLREVIINTQIQLLDAAVAAGVKRFIPSDYSLDFTNFNHGENRNLDLRREFHTYLDAQNIESTSIFNGAFMDMLTEEFPMIAFDKKRITYWGEARHEMGFTTMDDTANFTAFVALDDYTPRYMRIAGHNISPKELKKVMQNITGTPYELMRMGAPNRLARLIKIVKFLAPQKNKLYPAWQGMQYMHNMIDQRARLKALDNSRYPEIKWTTVDEMLSKHYQSLK
jgi:nucleoside-diphosphate-sugar epimerase